MHLSSSVATYTTSCFLATLAPQIAGLSRDVESERNKQNLMLDDLSNQSKVKLLGCKAVELGCASKRGMQYHSSIAGLAVACLGWVGSAALVLA